MAEKLLSKFRVSSRYEIYMHKSVAMAAWAFHERIVEREKKEDTSGILFDYWACLIFISYWQEAIIHFYGERAGIKPKFRDDFWKLLKKMNTAVGLDLKKGSDRHTIFENLRKIRNTLAHGKPILEVSSEEFIGTSEEVTERFYEIYGEAWQKHVTIEFLNKAYELTSEIENKVYEFLKINPIEISSGRNHSVEYLGPVTEKSTPA